MYRLRGRERERERNIEKKRKRETNRAFVACRFQFQLLYPEIES